MQFDGPDGSRNKPAPPVRVPMGLDESLEGGSPASNFSAGLVPPPAPVYGQTLRPLTDEDVLALCAEHGIELLMDEDETEGWGWIAEGGQACHDWSTTQADAARDALRRLGIVPIFGEAEEAHHLDPSEIDQELGIENYSHKRTGSVSPALQDAVERLWEAVANCTAFELDEKLRTAAVDARLVLARDLGKPEDVAYWEERSILNWLRGRQVEPEALDDLVHDLAGEEGSEAIREVEDLATQETLLAEFQKKGSDINNGGLAAQAAYILQQLGFDQARKEIESAVGG